MSPPPAHPSLTSLVPPPGELLRTQRKAGQSAVVGLMLLWCAAFVSPFVTYQADVKAAEGELLVHLSDRAGLQAQALGAHLGLLRSELQRLAEHPSLRPEDGAGGPEVALLENAFGHTSLFSAGVALVSANGQRIWSDPVNMPLGRTPLTSRPWFRRMVEKRAASVGLLDEEGGGLIAVAVPIVRDDRVVGLLVGELATASELLPVHRGTNESMVALLGERGRLLLPATPPPLLRQPELAAHLRPLVETPGAITLGGTRLLGAAALVPGTEMLLAVLEDEARDRALLKRRYLGQLGFHTALLGGVLLLFTVLLRRSYRSLMAAEEQLRRQETMAALGTASSLIAHEVKNALNSMQAALSMIRAKGGETTLPVQALRSQADRLGHLARSLLSFASPQSTQRRSCEMHLLVQDALQAVRLLPEAADVTIETTLQEGLFVKGDPTLLVSAVDNLIRNAVEAGAVAHDTGQQPTPRVEVRILREDGEVVLVVEDNAGGVPPAFEPRLWEPFAVGRSRGIGLGLPMVRTAIRAHDGGSVSYTRVPGGSRFTVRLPLEKMAS
ncbi:sensor histidine kinase [Corallococcus sp. AB038B]|uniref:sensor histidine kinase n=1 Tax=Corallococcus sp. AB038B TaxID=2316718 RepID=UPI000EBFC3EE|nr:sensor histidine kinase [Corallococcus sp. AB038B]RKI05249.1 sensor histidine kinase [Corallococcus sp. AB038B]